MNKLNKKAFSVIEYAMLFIIIVGGFLIMRQYIQRGMMDKWGQAGTSFGFGRQYDSQKTIECSFDEQSNLWYDHNCYAYYLNTAPCNGNPACAESAITSGTCTANSCGQVKNELTQ